MADVKKDKSGVPYSQQVARLRTLKLARTICERYVSDIPDDFLTHATRMVQVVTSKGKNLNALFLVEPARKEGESEESFADRYARFTACNDWARENGKAAFLLPDGQCVREKGVVTVPSIAAVYRDAAAVLQDSVTAVNMKTQAKRDGKDASTVLADVYGTLTLDGESVAESPLAVLREYVANTLDAAGKALEAFPRAKRLSIGLNVTHGKTPTTPAEETGEEQEPAF